MTGSNDVTRTVRLITTSALLASLAAAAPAGTTAQVKPAPARPRRSRLPRGLARTGRRPELGARLQG